MLKETFLCRLVVVRRDGKNSVGADFGKFASERDHFGGVVAACAGKDGHASLRQIHGDLYDAQMLFVRERGAFARRAARDEEIYPCVDLALDQRAERGFVERTVAAKWSD